MGTMTLTVGEVYTREEAYRALGCGPLQTFFAYKEGRPVAMFPQDRRNLFAREGIITIHDDPKKNPISGPLVERWIGERVPVHVFWGLGPNRWEYAGRWRPTADCVHERGPLFEALAAAYREQAPQESVHCFVVMEQLASDL
jgi:hypothetical protein